MDNEVEQVGSKKKYRLGWVAIFIWVGIAILCDVITFFVPVLGGPILGTIYFGAFSAYLWKSGHGLVNWKVVVPEGLGLIAEWIPAIQAFPFIVIPAGIIIFISRFEDKTGIKIPLPGKKPGTTPPRIQPPPLNQGGIRAPR